MNAQELIFRICAREAVSLLRLLDRTPKELVRTAANYGCSLEEFPAWVNQRVKRQLQKAVSANQAGPFTPVIAEGHYVERMQLAWPTGNVHSMVSDQVADTGTQTYNVADVDEQFYKVGVLEDRLVMCGTFQWRRTANSEPKRYTIRCSMFRHCDVCAAERADRYHGELVYAAVAIDDQGGVTKLNLVKVTTTDDKVAKALRRAHKKPVYRCLPQQNGTTVFYFSEQGYQADKYPDLEAELVSCDDLANEDWAELTQTPEGRRISGSLGVQPKKIKTGASVMLTGLQIKTPEGMTIEQVVDQAQDIADEKAKRPPCELTPEVWAAWLEAQQAAFEAACTDLGARVTQGFEYKVWFQDVSMSLKMYVGARQDIQTKRPVDANDDDIPVPF